MKQGFLRPDQRLGGFGLQSCADVYQLTINDHTSLGGPMGSESVKPILQELFTSKDLAERYAETYIRAGYKEYDKQYSSNAELRRAWGDLGAIGVRITKLAVYGSLKQLKGEKCKRR